MLKKLSILAACLAVVACSDSGSDEQAQPQLKGMGAFDESVELTVRDGDNYLTSTYSFYHQTRDDKELTRNGWSIQMSKSGDGLGGIDQINTEMVVNEVGFIADLGEMSCKDIKLLQEDTEEYPGVGKGGVPHAQHRQTDPEFWFRYSDAANALDEARESTVEVKVGHCYIMRKISSDNDIVAAFRVKEQDLGKTVVIDEIEVFKKEQLIRVKAQAN